LKDSLRFSFNAPFGENSIRRLGEAALLTFLQSVIFIVFVTAVEVETIAFLKLLC
jgi:hypothetical protein